jgi:membrane associated rhomboid family serine protease
MVFLAFVGRTRAVEAIVAPTGPMSILPEAARQFWSGVARLNAGDRSGARLSLEHAAKLSGRDRRARDLAEATLRSIDEPGVVGPHSVPPDVAALADRLSALAADVGPMVQTKRTPALTGVSWRQVPVTSALVAVNVVIAGLVAYLYGSTSDMGGLMRAGANVKSAVAAGEWWRLPASMFLHVGVMHLVLNMFGLWILGKILEQMYGRTRFFAVYMMSGIAGALASYVFGPPGMSAGASGAVLGILGAAAAELALHRKAYPEQWRRALLGNLAFLIVANVLIGVMYPAIDQSAHVGGLVTGALLAAVVSRKSGYAYAPIVRVAALTFAMLGAAAIAYGGVGVATTEFSDTMARYPRVTQEMSGLSMMGPCHWQRVEADKGVELIDSAPLIALWTKRIPVPAALRTGSATGVAVDVDAELDQLLRTAENGNGKSRSFDAVRRPIQQVVTVPPPWRSRELMTVLDGDGTTQKYRIVVFGRSTADELWLGRIHLPATLAGGADELVGGILESIAPAKPAAEAPAHESL